MRLSFGKVLYFHRALLHKKSDAREPERSDARDHKRPPRDIFGSLRDAKRHPPTRTHNSLIQNSLIHTTHTHINTYYTHISMPNVMAYSALLWSFGIRMMIGMEIRMVIPKVVRLLCNKTSSETSSETFEKRPRRIFQGRFKRPRRRFRDVSRCFKMFQRRRMFQDCKLHCDKYIVSHLLNLHSDTESHLLANPPQHHLT